MTKIFICIYWEKQIAVLQQPCLLLLWCTKIKCLGKMKVKSVDFLRGNMCVII